MRDRLLIGKRSREGTTVTKTSSGFLQHINGIERFRLMRTGTPPWSGTHVRCTAGGSRAAIARGSGFSEDVFPISLSTCQRRNKCSPRGISLTDVHLSETCISLGW